MQDDPENDPDGEAAQRPTSFLEFWFLRKREQESSGRWECGNPAWLAGFPRDGGKRGKPGFGFPRFPRARHFHGPWAVQLQEPWWRKRRFDLGDAKQLGFGRAHLSGKLGIAHGLCQSLQRLQTDSLFQVVRWLGQRLEFLVRCGIVVQLVLALALAARVEADRGKAARTMEVQ